MTWLEVALERLLCTEVEMWNFKGLFLNSGAAHYIAEALKENTDVRSMDLHSSHFGPEGVQILADVFGDSTLRVISLDYNVIQDDGARHLAAALKDNPALRAISLARNNIGKSGAQCLAEALKQNSTVEEILLGDNRFGPEGACHLAEALKENAALQKIHLGWNNVGDEGARHLAGALRANVSLRDLSFGHENSISNLGAEHLAAAMEHNTTLIHLHIGDRGIDVELLQSIAQQVAHNADPGLRKRKQERLAEGAASGRQGPHDGAAGD
eukprot:EG_transcript_21847